LEPEFASGAVPTVTVRGYDGRNRLLRGRKTRSFIQLKDSEIASQIASDHGLSADATDTGVTFDYILQHNQSDLHFLLERARRIGYEVIVADKTLQFRPRPAAESPALTLTLEDLLEFHPRLTTMGQISQLSIRGWSVKDKAAVVANAEAGGPLASMGGSTSGPAAAESAFGAAATATVDLGVSDHAEADGIARGRLNEIALGYITAEGVCAGRTDLRSGSVVEITGLGKRFSGRYYVTATRHSYRPDRGYRTEFTARRNTT
jgi:phage protein D